MYNVHVCHTVIIGGLPVYCLYQNSVPYFLLNRVACCTLLKLFTKPTSVICRML